MQWTKWIPLSVVEVKTKYHEINYSIWVGHMAALNRPKYLLSHLATRDGSR